MRRRLLVFPLRLAATGVAVGALLYVARAPLCALLARAAHDVVVLTSCLPHLVELSWEGDRFHSATRVAAGRLTIEGNLFLLVVGLPVAFAVALPAVGSAAWWRRLTGAALVSVAVSALSLAVVVDGKAFQEASRLGLRLNPAWRDLLVRTAMLHVWDLGALLYPFAICAWLAWTGLLTPPRPRAEARGPRPRLATALAVGVVVAGVVAVDALARSRLRMPVAELDARIVAMNPGRGAAVLEGARRYEERGRYGKALHAYALAAGYPQQRGEAQRGVARMQARTSAR